MQSYSSLILHKQLSYLDGNILYFITTQLSHHEIHW